jgi:hypothetical protein
VVIEGVAVLAASKGIAANWGLPVQGQRQVDRRSARPGRGQHPLGRAITVVAQV